MARPRALSTNEFQGHQTSAPRGSFLERAKKWPPVARSQPPVLGVNVVLAKGDSIYVLWRHGLPRIQISEKDGSRMVWGGNFVCHEEERPTLINQFRRDRETGERLHPPQACPICKMVEWCWQQIDAGKLDWLTEVFRFEADIPKDTRVLHAGGLCNIFGKKDLDDEQKKEMKRHGIYQTDAWKEVAWAKANYLFLVADYDHPENGVQIAIEPAGLGEKVRGVISDERVSKGEDEGDPQKNPYVIQWTYNPADGVEFGKYHARRIDRMPITPEIEALISGPLPDVENLLQPFNAIELRAQLEEAALIELPWDEFFGPGQAPAQQERRTPSVAPPLKNIASAVAGVGGPAEEEFDCDQCGKGPIVATGPCKFCGFDPDAPLPPPPQEPPRRRRGVAPSSAPKAPSAGLAAKAPQNASQGQQSPPPKGGGGVKPVFPDDDGDVPFLTCAFEGGAERWGRR